jgi:hypothetical protein
MHNKMWRVGSYLLADIEPHNNIIRKHGFGSFAATIVGGNVNNKRILFCAAE